MVISVLAIQARGGREAEFERIFMEDLDVLGLAREAAGMLDGYLVRDPGGTGRYLAIARWPDAAAYDRWLHHRDRDEVARRLRDLAEPIGHGALYETVPSKRRTDA